jgi:hypothetical protein
MITTVNTNTAASLAALAAMGLVVPLGIGSGAMLIILLCTRQLALSASGEFALRLARFSLIAIVPFLFGFAIILAVRFVEVILTTEAR